MRVMAKITIPVESGSRAVKDGSIMPDSSDMVSFGEPFFMALDADVEVVPVMNADDLQKGSGKLG